MSLIDITGVKEVSTFTGTGAVPLGGSPSGFNTFASVMADQDTCYYTIQSTAAAPGEVEFGLGTYNATANTLSRTTVIRGSNGTSLVNFSHGVKEIILDWPAGTPHKQLTLTGDITGSGAGSVAATIGAGAVTYAKIQNVSATARVLGRKSAGAGVIEELAKADVVTLLGGAQNTTGTTQQTAAGSGAAVKVDSTTTGGTGTTAYTLADVVLALKHLGLLAS
jgi:hypothetical protein